MSGMYPLWLDRVLQDLTNFSSQLLEPGLGATAFGVKSGQVPSPLSSVLQKIDMFVELVPRGLSELELSESRSGSELVTCRTPLRALPSKRPSDYVVRDGRALPRCWMREDEMPVLPDQPLRWLVGMVDSLRQQLNVQASRLDKQLEMARFARAGTSVHAIADLRALDLIQGQIIQSAQRLHGMTTLVARQAGRSVAASRHFPNPYPRGESWQQLRLLANAVFQPELQLGRWLGTALRHPVPIADVPYLYQRWCGLQILNSVRRLGWQPHGELVGPLFLGGLIHLKCDGETIELWVEPRLSEGHATRIGWKCNRGMELTPDFLFVTGEPGNRDAFVLDATLSTSPEYLLEKTRYRDLLVGVDAQFIAGVPLLRRPIRAWSAAPIRSPFCNITDSQGIGGTVPLDASQNSFSGLDAWLDDVLTHARAVRLRRPAPSF